MMMMAWVTWHWIGQRILRLHRHQEELARKIAVTDASLRQLKGHDTLCFDFHSTKDTPSERLSWEMWISRFGSWIPQEITRRWKLGNFNLG